MVDSNSATTSQGMKIRAYGVSASSVRKSIEEITGVNPKKKAILTKETGRVCAESEKFSGGGNCYCDCGSPGGDGEEIVMRLLMDEYSFSPDHQMAFEEDPRVVPKLSA